MAGSPRGGAVLLTGALLASALTAQAAAAAPTVEVWRTTGDGSVLLARQADAEFGTGGGAATVIDVDETTSYQTIDGFGAAFTDSAAHLVNDELAPAARDELMTDLFGADGIGLSMLRQPLGASDFTHDGDYTYDDTCCDLSDLSVVRDRDDVLPLVRQAKRINPELKLIGTPWSAPAWMKTNEDLDGGALRPENNGLLADYLVGTAQAYADAGLPLDYLSVQNEPYHPETPDGGAGYPSMHMDPAQQAAIIGDELGPKLAEAGLGTKILAWDHNWDHPEYPAQVVDDPEAGRHTAGAAFHCYGGSVGAQREFHQEHPDKGTWLTECSGGAWSPDFADNLEWNTRNLIIGGIRNWAKGVTFWNIALDQNHGPTNGGCTDCRGVVTVDTETGQVHRNVEYYVLGHVAKFVRPGATRIESTSNPEDIETVAFRNPGGGIVLLALNSAGAERSFQVRHRGRSFEHTLPAGAVTTFTWQP
ncbi:glycoside hydrolase family 30 protein [Saccharopolyspora halophila]